MKHATPPNGCLSALVTLTVVVVCATSASAQPTPTATPNPIFVCSGRLTSGVINFTTNYGDLLGQCALEKLDGGACDNLEQGLQNAIDDLAGEIGDCDLGALDALCPLEGDTPAEVNAAFTGPSAESFRAKLTQLIADVFTTPYGSCARPTSAVSSDALECATEVSDLIGTSGNTEELEKCFFSCERPRILNAGLEVCVDDVIGDPVKQSVIDCRTNRLSALETIEERCTSATLQELGCPLGTDSPAGLRAALEERLATLVQELNLGIFHSDCRGSLPGEPTTPQPATVTLGPSGTQKQLSCGQTIDGAFMGDDTTVSFDEDLDCGPSSAATDGIVIGKSAVKLSGRAGKLWSIRGPQRSSLRTGAGIKLLPGVSRVDIRNFKAIENFGVGILDAEDGSNRKLGIQKTTVRRNIQAGLRIRSTRAVINEVTADKNGIGMDLSGDGSKVRNSSAKGSLYPPKIGIQLSGTDRNLNGSVVVVSPLNTIEFNGGAGVKVLAGGHIIEQSQIRNNLGNGVEIDPLAAGSQVKQNTVKFNAHGIVVNGDQTLVDGNDCEENLGDGFVIAGTGNTVTGNGSGAKTDRGNGGAGFRIMGASVALQNNAAEANLGSGFVVTGTTTRFESNTSEVNWQHGFDIQSSGHVFDTCAAEGNNVEDPPSPAEPFHEWALAPGNSAAGDSNSAGGDTIGIPADGGFCDDDNDCPLQND